MHSTFKSRSNPFRLGVFISGRGTNLQSLLDRFPKFGRVRVSLVVSGWAGVEGLARAQRLGVPSYVIRPEYYSKPEQFGNALLRVLRNHEIDLIVLAGYLKKVPASVVEAFRDRIINIHPALLPLFGGEGMYGRRVHQAVIESGMRVSGVTVHFVTEEYDAGPIIAQRPVPVYSDDTPETLAARVLEVEHKLLPDVVEWIAAGKVRVSESRRVIIEGDREASAGSVRAVEPVSLASAPEAGPKGSEPRIVLPEEPSLGRRGSGGTG